MTRKTWILMLVVAAAAAVAVQSLQHTAWQAWTNRIVVVVLFAAAGMIVYRNLKTGPRNT